jgi:uncharacterized protein (TIGR01777 family)
MRIVIAGGSGFLGERLLPALRADGHELVRLVRRPPGRADEVRWDPARSRLEPEAVAGADAVINLAGANPSERRWTPAFKRLILSSRVEPTSTLARTLAALPAERRPAVLLNASAVGWYGDTGDRPVTEESPPGQGYFPQVCRRWEEATEPASDAGVRVVRLRTGLPLQADSWVFKPMILQFRLFAGGRMGSGRQYLPWIAMADWLAAVRFLLDHTDIAGPVNLVSPEPVREAEFARALGRVLHRPAIWPIPAFALRLALGEYGSQAVISQRVLPGVLTGAGFPFQYSTVDTALRAALEPAS